MGLKVRTKEITGFTGWFGKPPRAGRLYFAYGSNMNEDQMNTRCPKSKALAIGTLSKHKFLINSRGVATVIPDENHSVFGVIWLLSPGDEISLDYYEGVKEKVYYKKSIRVRVLNDQFPALIYIANDVVSGVPRQGYLEKVIEGAQTFNANQEWVQELRNWSPDSI